MSQSRLARSSSESDAKAADEMDGMEAWWEDFLKQQKEAQPDSPFEMEDLRKVFEKERRILERLFEPIRELMAATLKDDKMNRGARLYDEWGKIRRKECLLSYYDNEYFRAMYARQRFLNSATSFMQALHLRIIPETAGVAPFLAGVTRVVSVGVGPGSDMAGFLAYSRSRGMDQRIVYYTMDQCNEWAKYIHAFDKRWSSEFKMSAWFKHVRFGKRDTVEVLPDADMLVFSFANTSLMDPAIWPLLQERYPLVIVLDGIKEVLIDGFCESSFTKFQLNEKTNVYYSFRDPNAPPSTEVPTSTEEEGGTAIAKCNEDAVTPDGGDAIATSGDKVAIATNSNPLS